MAPVPLNISPSLRPWRQAGITHLLLDDDVRERLLASIQAKREASAQEERQPKPYQPPARPGGAVSPRAPSAPRTPEPAATSPARSAVLSRPAPAPETPAQPEGPAMQPAIRTVPQDRWPAYWQALLKKTPPRPALVWTYPSLSRDLGGAADAAHRDYLRRLLGDMRMPKGSHAFWPLNSYPYAEGESEQTVDAAMFLGGIAALNPDTVILMCGDVPQGLGLDELRLLMPVIVHGRRFVVTPHVDELIQDPQRHAQLMTFLKAVIAGR